MRTWASLLLMGFTMAGCAAPDGGDPGSGGDGRRTWIEATDEGDGNLFNPYSFNVTAGVEVLWRNTGQRHHTVTIQDPEGEAGDYLEDAGDLAPGAEFRHTFPQPGTYDVFCQYHSRGEEGVFSPIEMTMKVLVDAA